MEDKDACRVLEGKPDGKSPLGKPRRLWKANIKIKFRTWGLEVHTGLIWFWKDTGGGHLSMRY
jgi:hypothetical protein